MQLINLNKGLITLGDQIIGTFKLLTAEDSYGRREIINLITNKAMAFSIKYRLVYINNEDHSNWEKNIFQDFGTGKIEYDKNIMYFNKSG